MRRPAVVDLTRRRSFELKSFVGRVNSGRRKQVERSLTRAVEHSPRVWHLVVPIDPTPAEQSWFADLTADAPCECYWRGLTWLDSEFAKHPDVVRYYTAGSADEVVDLLRELQAEQAALSRGIPDAVDRLRRLTARLGALDPHYSFALSSQPDGSVSVSVIPKYRGAELDRPITMGTTFSFPDSEEERAVADAFRDALDYGMPIVVPADYVKSFTVDAPAGAGGTFEGGEITIGPSSEPFPPDVRLALRIVGGSGEPLAELPLQVTSRGTGQRGVTLDLADVSGLLTAKARISAERLQMTFTLSLVGGALPAVLLPAARLMRVASQGAHRGVLVVNGREIAAPSPLGGPIEDGVDAWLWAIERLETVQRLSGVFFPMPDELRSDELHAIDEAAALLEGETLRGTWSRLTLLTDREAVDRLREGPLNGAEANDLEQLADLTLTLGDNTIPLGKTRRLFASATVEAWPDTSELLPQDPVKLELLPGTDATVLTERVEADVKG